MRDPAKKRACQARYALTPKGIETRKRYFASEKGKATYRRYRKTFAGKLFLDMNDHRPDVKLRKRLYLQSWRHGHA